MGKKILSLLLAVAVMTSVFTTAIAISVSDSETATSFADDWSKWSANHKSGYCGKANADEHGYNVMYSAGGSDKNSFTYADTLDLGDKFDFGYKVTLSPAWGSQHKGLSYTVKIGELSVIIAGNEAGSQLTLSAEYNGQTVISSGKTLTPDTSSAVITAVESAAKAASGAAEPQFMTQLYDVSLKFENGTLTLYYAGEVYGSCVLSSYSFSKVQLSVLPSFVNYNRAAVFDISGTKYTPKDIPDDEYVLPYYEKDSIFDMSANKWTMFKPYGKAVITTAAEHGYDAFAVEGRNFSSEEKLNTFTYNDSVNLGNKFSVGYKARIHNIAWNADDSGTDFAFEIGSLRICIVGSDNFRAVKLAVYHNGELVFDNNVNLIQTYDTDFITNTNNALINAGFSGNILGENGTSSFAISAEFDDGVLVLKSNGKEYGRCRIYDYDFTDSTVRISVRSDSMWGSYCMGDIALSGVSRIRTTDKTIEELNPGKTLYTEWTDSDEGGYLTRTCLANGDVERKAKAEVYAAGVTLTSGFALRFSLVDDFDKYYSDISAASPNGNLTFDEKTNKAYIMNVGAKNMGKKYTVTYTAVDKATGERVTFSKSFSLLDYAKAMYATTENDRIKTVLADMLNFGAASQVYFNTDVKNLVNTDTSVMASASEKVDSSTLESKMSLGEGNSTADINWYGASLVLKDKIDVKYYVKASAATMATEGLKLRLVVDYDEHGSETYEVDASEFEAAAIGGKSGYYSYTFDKLAPNRMEDKIVAQFVTADGTAKSVELSYSISSYAKAKSDSTVKGLGDLVDNLITYGRACKSYNCSTWEHPYSSTSIWNNKLKSGATYTDAGLGWTYEFTDENWNKTGKTQKYSYGIDSENLFTTDYSDDYIYRFTLNEINAYNQAIGNGSITGTTVKSDKNGRWAAFNDEAHLEEFVAWYKSKYGTPNKMYFPKGQTLAANTISGLFDSVTYVPPGNECTSVLQPDGKTVIEFQPTCRAWYLNPDDNGNKVVAGYIIGNPRISRLDSEGNLGTHWGSGMSTVGGSIRSGELTGDGNIEHALKLDVYGYLCYYMKGELEGYQWPADRCDGAAPNPKLNTYNGYWGGYCNKNNSDAKIVMGSLLALKKDVTVESLGIQTEIGKKLFYTLQNYGCYIVDDSAWPQYNFCAESTVPDEVYAKYGINLRGKLPNNDNDTSVQAKYARDIQTIISNLCVVSYN